ncbi:fluoride efflux transporter CrcB [Zhouia spongiae]|uniref:Fluoride-specific ion channel FluC n=1 Tax=Zhouia spongiae TaxID=2202721 RepID=A0ABY3YIE6_9FLAO|nr:fluoride efflux transporter CrcB [Zhouia spongiae]UNY97378.1 fluoride efflux transporter CrcB [Zhouia spongiae]
MREFLWIFLGGGLGSMARYIVSKLVYTSSHNFPLSTFSVNIIGSLIIGLITGLAAKQTSISHNLLLFAVTGFCGGFTTFSTFALENVSLLREGDYFNFFLYSIGSIISGLLAVLLGFVITKAF